MASGTSSFQKPQQKLDIIRLYENKRFLVIDDLTEARGEFKRMLREFGAKNIDTAATDNQAIEMVDCHEYGVILSDYNLNQSRDGQQLLEEMRAQKMLKWTTLFVIITGETSREMVLGALENQPDDYLTKPVSQKLLNQRLDRVLIKHEELLPIKTAMESGNFLRANKLCDELLASTSRYKQDAWRYKAQVFLMLQQPEEAIEVYQQARQEYDLPWVKLGLARCKLMLKQLDGVEDLLKEVIDIDSRFIEAHDLLADYYQQKQQFKKTQNSVKKATELSPKSIQRHRRLAALAELNGDQETALSALEEAVRWNHNSCFAEAEDYMKLARKTIELTSGKTDSDSIKNSKKAVALLDRMARRFETDSKDVKKLLLESQLHAIQGKKEMAASQLKIVEEKWAPDEATSIETRLDYAKTHMAIGEKEKANMELYLAAQEFGEDENVMTKINAIAEEPIDDAGKKTAADFSSRGIKAYQKKEYDTAINIFSQAVRLFPNHVGNNLNMVQAILALGKKDSLTDKNITWCQQCFRRVEHIGENHKQFDRLQILQKQFGQLQNIQVNLEESQETE